MQRNNKPRVSVIMPCHNSERYIAFAIDSILTQTFIDFELIVIDDASSDRTCERVLNIKDRRIVYIRSDVKIGSFAARNIGMRRAQGKYICFMDSDDISFPDRLLMQYNYLEKHKSIGLVGCQAIDINESGELIDKTYNQQPFQGYKIKVLLLVRNFFINSTLFFRKTHIHKHNLFYIESFGHAADYDFLIRATRHFAVANMSESLVKYRSHPTQTSLINFHQKKILNDQVRLNYLNDLEPNFSTDETGLYLKMINRDSTFSYSELQQGIECLNKVLELNYFKREFNQKYMYEVFNFIIADAHDRIPTGMAIENAVVQYILDRFPKNSTILEFGAGEGTNRLLKNYRVISIEHDPEYAFKRAENHTPILSPISNNWYTIPTQEIPKLESADLIIIDGPPRELRAGILHNLELFRDLRVPIIFDDVNRPLDQNVMIRFCEALSYEYLTINGTLKKFGFCIPVKLGIGSTNLTGSDK
jgi:glycosyltransferase involved in cell wall biosynthesis